MIRWAFAEDLGGFLVTSLIIWGGMRSQFEIWKHLKLGVI